MEIESALVSHEKVAEAAVVGLPDDLTGTAIVAFVTPKQGTPVGRAFAEDLRTHVAHQIGGIAKPADIRFTDALPKTRSGKIMRRLLRRRRLRGKTVGDTTTLEDFSAIPSFRSSRKRPERADGSEAVLERAADLDLIQVAEVFGGEQPGARRSPRCCR